MILTIVFLVSLVMFIVGLTKQVSHEGYDIPGRGGYLVLRIVGGIVGGMTLAGFLVTNCDCYAKNAQMLAMKQNIEVYQQAAKSINEIAVVSPVAGGTMISGIENIQQSQNPSELVKLSAELQVELNVQIQCRKMMLVNPWSGWWYIPLPRGL